MTRFDTEGARCVVDELRRRGVLFELQMLLSIDVDSVPLDAIEATSCYYNSMVSFLRRALASGALDSAMHSLQAV